LSNFEQIKCIKFIIILKISVKNNYNVKGPISSRKERNEK
jgi:hypothetical protein